MTERLASPFDCTVVWLYNNSTAIGIGEAVQWGTVVSVEYPEAEPAGSQWTTLANQSARTTSAAVVPIMGVKQAATIGDQNSFCAIALKAVAATSWGPFALCGRCDVKIGPSASITAGDFLIVSAAGAFAEHPGIATATAVHAVALEGCVTSGTCAAALISAWVPAQLHVGDHALGGASTA